MVIKADRLALAEVLVLLNALLVVISLRCSVVLLVTLVGHRLVWVTDHLLLPDHRRPLVIFYLKCAAYKSTYLLTYLLTDMEESAGRSAPS